MRTRAHYLQAKKSGSPRSPPRRTSPPKEAQQNCLPAAASNNPGVPLDALVSQTLALLEKELESSWTPASGHREGRGRWGRGGGVVATSII